MAKYKVIKVFRNKETDETYSVGQEVELTVKRASEIEKTLKPLGKFIERIKEEKFKTEEKD